MFGGTEFGAIGPTSVFAIAVTMVAVCYSAAITPPLLGTVLLGFARLCRQLPPGAVRIMAETPGFSSN